MAYLAKVTSAKVPLLAFIPAMPATMKYVDVRSKSPDWTSAVMVDAALISDSPNIWMSFGLSSDVGVMYITNFPYLLLAGKCPQPRYSVHGEIGGKSLVR